MICLDSWIWLEYLFDGESSEQAKTVISQAADGETGGIVPATVVAEVSYRLTRERDEATATAAIEAMRRFDHIDILPVTDEIAEYGAQLRSKYYRPNERELSYADSIHLAMASAVNECETLYTGDPDLGEVDEVETVVLHS